MKKYVTGIDISKEKPDLCFVQNEKVLREEETADTTAAVRQALKTFLKEACAETSDVPVCAEYTGQYIRPLCCACKELGVDLWQENPAQIKYGSGMQRGRNDRLDARRIAACGFRFQDKARLYNLPQENITSLQQLAGERDMYVSDKSRYQGQLTDRERFMRKKDYRQKSARLKELIKGLKKSICQAEKEIKEVIESDETLYEQHKRLCTAEGIGDKTAVKMIVVTKGFTDARKFCCHADPAPFSYSSGSSIRSRNRVSPRADKSVKALLHMAAPVVATGCKGELHDYYERKVAEGKNKMSVLNAVRAKLIHRMFAVIRNNQDYQKDYLNALA
ncbi:Transposase IS116/IS110/IS902 family protein [Bacteroidales bacterium Barb6XT]|nr:Transposase IS116/IS110/IS902 family protein [Bacteroidales bacterium Barb6XT]